MNYRNLVQFVGYEGPIHMNEDQFRAFWNPLSEPYMREGQGGVSKIILSQVCKYTHRLKILARRPGDPKLEKKACCSNSSSWRVTTVHLHLVLSHNSPVALFPSFGSYFNNHFKQ